MKRFYFGSKICVLIFQFFLICLFTGYVTFFEDRNIQFWRNSWTPCLIASFCSIKLLLHAWLSNFTVTFIAQQFFSHESFCSLVVTIFCFAWFISFQVKPIIRNKMRNKMFTYFTNHYHSNAISAEVLCWRRRKSSRREIETRPIHSHPFTQSLNFSVDFFLNQASWVEHYEKRKNFANLFKEFFIIFS